MMAQASMFRTPFLISILFAVTIGIDVLVALIIMDLATYEFMSRVRRACSTLAGTDLVTAERLLESGKHYLRDSARTWIGHREQMPIMVLRSGDGTPATCRRRWSLGNGSLRVNMEGSEMMELLVERTFLVDSFGDCRCVLHEPTPLVDSKNSWVIFHR